MRALLLVDVQNDFMPWGSLPVADGDAVVAVANQVARSFQVVVASQDWHPADHQSFASTHPGRKPGEVVELMGDAQVLWPDHCVQNTPGASFHSGLDVSVIDAVVHKGTDPTIDSYSVFFDNAHKRATGLQEILRARDVDEVYLLGLATDYCVRWSALDARHLGLRVAVLSDGVRAVDLSPGDGTRALDELRQAGCTVITSAEIVSR